MSDQSIKGNNNNQAGRDLVINYGDFVTKNPSLVARVIVALSQIINYEINETTGNLNRFEIDQKLNYNNVIRYRSVIDQYGMYGGQVESVCTSLDTDKPNSKQRLLRYIEAEYVKAKGKYVSSGVDEQSSIREHSDDIIDDVHTAIFEILSNAEGIEDVDIEDRKIILLILLSKAFIDCKLLEKPIL